MTEDSNEKSTPTLHDRIFKEFLHRFLPEFIELFFPEEAARLDFSRMKFLEQELIINLPDHELRITDVVAEVAERGSNDSEIILIHVEVEANDKRTLPEREFEYYSLLSILRQKRVFPIALVLLPRVGGVTWQTYVKKLWDRELVRFTYAQVGIRDLDSMAYLQENNPISASLAVLMKSKRKERAELKLKALRSIIQSSLTEGDKLFLMSIVESYLPKEKLPIDLRGDMMETLKESEMMWHERIAYKAKLEGKQEGELEGELRGEIKGELKGKRTLLFNLLTAKFGPLPESFLVRFNAILDSRVLDRISLQILTAESLSDITLPDSN